MTGKLDLATRRLLAHFRAKPRGSAFHILARRAETTGKALVVLRIDAELPRAA